MGSLILFIGIPIKELLPLDSFYMKIKFFEGRKPNILKEIFISSFFIKYGCLKSTKFELNYKMESKRVMNNYFVSLQK